LARTKIERMKRDAEAHAAEDKARREVVDLKNRPMRSSSRLARRWKSTAAR
jgi:molecular chaperone DnaK (HSP70)